MKHLFASRRPWDAPGFAKCYCAAVVTAVAGVAAAGTSAYSAYNQNKATKGAQAALAGDKSGAYGTKVKPVKYQDHVNLPGYDAQAGANDYDSSLPMLGTIAQTVTTQAQRQRDLLSGGQSTTNLQQEGADINGLLKGQVPTDVQGQINRMVAARTGGAFSPTGQANQSAEADFARKIGLTSTQMMQMGMSAAPQWESMVDAFTYKPQQAYTDALSALRERDSYTTNAAQIQFGRDQAAYQGAVNYEKMKSMPNPQIQGFTNDNLQLNSLSAQQQQNAIAALMGTVKSAGAAYSAIGGGSDPYNNSGFITSGGLGSAYQIHATPGYTPTFGGSAGSGYYFTGYTPKTS